MYAAISRKSAVAIGILAMCLTAISPASTWSADPVKPEKKTKKLSQTQTSTSDQKATPPKFASAETAGKAPSVSVKHLHFTRSRRMKGKPETES